MSPPKKPFEQLEVQDLLEFYGIWTLWGPEKLWVRSFGTIPE